MYAGTPKVILRRIRWLVSLTIGGVSVCWTHGATNPIRADTAPVRHADFLRLQAMPGVGEYKTLRGNKPAVLVAVSNARRQFRLTELSREQPFSGEFQRMR